MQRSTARKQAQTKAWDEVEKISNTVARAQVTKRKHAIERTEYVVAPPAKRGDCAACGGEGILRDHRNRLVAHPSAKSFRCPGSGRTPLAVKRDAQ